MTEEAPNERDEEPVTGDGGIGPTNYAASASEAGSLYSDRGPTTADTSGEPLSDDSGAGGEDRESDQGPSIGDVYRGGA